MKESPKTLKETAQYIDDLNIKNIDIWLKIKDESEAIHNAHFGLGTQIRNELKLWSDECELRKWFMNTYMLDHADDTSSIILTYYYRTKNEKNTNISDIVKKYHDHWSSFDNFFTPSFSKKLRKFKLNKINKISYGN